MNKMTVIQLLNKIANGEEVPEKIKYLNRIYEYSADIRDYEDNDYSYEDLYDKYLTSRMFKNGNTENMLNSKLEIIKENKKIEKIVAEIVKGQHYYEIEDIVNKLNEVIDYINKENEND